MVFKEIVLIVTVTILMAFAQLAQAAVPAPDEPKVVKPTAEEIKKGQDRIEEALKAMNAEFARVQVLLDEPTLRAFPRYLFFSVMFPQYPVGRIPPEGLASSNVYAIQRGDGKLQPLTNSAKVEAFFKNSLAPVRDDDRAKDAARAWVQLSSNLVNDGFYKFTLMDDSTKVTQGTAGREVTAKLVAMAGGNGDLVGTMAFDDAGKLSRASVKSSLRPGPRPICQATKLLDADPIVRRIAEQDVLIMGRAAKPYLDEQRAKASPELKQAIDRIWQRILDEDR